MPGTDRRRILQLIIEDTASTPVERIEAQRALGELSPDQPVPSPRRHGRNANVPQTQADIDADIENSFRYDRQLTMQDRIEIERGLPESTRAILDAFGSPLLWLFGNNDAEIELLIDLHRRTQSEFVRAKAAQTIKWIADYSPIESAKTEAKQFLNQLDQIPQENQ